MRPTWAEVSLGTLRRNFRAIQKHVGDKVTVCAVVKADAYGHGAVECARALEAEGATWLGVTCTEEGIALREAGIRGRILLMTGFWRGDEQDVVRHRLTPAIWEWWQVGALESALGKLAPNEPFPIHVKVDTGMARLGVPDYFTNLFLKRLKAAAGVTVEGVFTHLASAEVVDAPDVEAQAAKFSEFEKSIREKGFELRFWHVANSAAIALRPQLHRDMVRPGISLYGYQLPFADAAGKPSNAPPLAVSPVLSWKTRIISLRDVKAGQAVGYGGTHVMSRAGKLAVLPLGYADGLNRHLSSQGRVLVRGHYAPIAGRVSMDITVADVTDVDGAAVGDEVTILGADADSRIDAWEHARLAHSIPYEILCNISKRVPRKYVE